ncbi:MAG: 16S rRNA (cytidine(1402)-2'-O)-methyltransferase [Actinomycetota bacterium]|nr:16S rRNA (cytidine(1402)-2'-O)-methyltransferase [Actinomycetota bacterium]
MSDRPAGSRPSGGALVLVATPIGNLGDLSPRAVEELAAADAIACEDTRRTGRLLQHADVRGASLLRVDDHTEASRVAEVVDRVGRGERIAVVTDAGTPGIADPGERLVRAVADAGLRVEVVPGPSAAIAALVASGLPTGRFVFEGFLPRKGGARSERLDTLAAERRTVVLYEAPHRAARTLADLAEAFGAERRVAVGRELTKMFEEIWRGTLAEAVDWAAEGTRGELVIVLDGAPEPAPPDDDAIRAALDAQLAGGASRRDASAAVARALGVPRRRVYDLAIR